MWVNSFAISRTCFPIRRYTNKSFVMISSNQSTGVHQFFSFFFHFFYSTCYVIYKLGLENKWILCMFGGAQADTLVKWWLECTAARIMSTTSKISNTGGWLNPQLEKKLNLLFSYRNIWKHKIEFINIKNHYSPTNVCTIYSIFWTWIWKISIASWNKKLAFYCKYLAFFTIFWHWNLNSKNWHFTTNWETSNPPAYQFWTYYPR